MVQMEGHGHFEDHEYSRPELSSGETQKYGLEDLEKTSKQDMDVDFDPSAPYSSSMDDVPLKVLFGVPHVKMRQGLLHEKKTVQIDKTSPKEQPDSSDSVRRSILRESLASALAMVGDEKHKKDLVTEKDLHAEKVVSESHLNVGFQVVKTDQTDCKPVTDKYCENGESPKTSKREREDIEWKQEVAEAPVSSQGCLAGGLQESDLYVPIGDMPENCTFKKIKLDREETREETDQHAMEVYEAVAIQIEAELFRIYGGVNKKYREKARSLIFNLKDKNNPELRARVVSGEISPKSLCCMSAQQLASKELSQWRIAKAEQFAHMVVLPDLDVDFRRLVKKTHKGEFQVEVENDDASLELVAGEGHLMSMSQVKQEHAETNQLANGDQVIDKIDRMDPNEIVEDYPTHLSPRILSGQADGEAVTDMGTNEVITTEPSKERKLLPEIVSLDDYVGSWGEQSNEDVGADIFHMEGPTQWRTTDLGMLGSEEPESGFKVESLMAKTDCVNGEKIGFGSFSASDKIKCSNWVGELQVGKTNELSHDEKLWEGILQLGINSMATVTAFLKSGEKVSANDWFKFVEIKGRVRLDAFEKFLQELPLSRSRALMVVSFYCKDGFPENGLTSMREFADSYRQGDRVGFAEPAPGTELYLCPYDIATMRMLSKYDSCKNLEIVNDQDGLIGCVVWRRNNVTSNATPKMPEKYMNAKQLALSGHLLDSPTHAGVAELIPCGADSPKLDRRDHFEQYSVKIRGQTMESEPKSVEVKDGMYNADQIQRQFCHALDADVPPGFSSWTASTSLCDLRTDVARVVHLPAIDDDVIDDIPPGFGPKPAVMKNNVSVQDQLTNLDDDDLPEFDYGVSVTSQPLSNQGFVQNINLQSLSPSHSCSQLSPVQASTVCNPDYFQLNVPLISPQSQLSGHQNVQHAPRPPTTPHPSTQIRELIQKFGQGEVKAPFSSGSCFPDSPRVNTSSHIGQQAGHPTHLPANSESPLPSSHVVEEKRWNDEDDIPEWHPPYLQPGNGPVPLMPPVGTELPPQLGMPNFVGNLPSVLPTPPRVPPPLRVPQIPPPLIPPPLPRGPPPLPRVPPPSIGMAQPVPMLVTQGNRGLMHANNSVIFHPDHNFRPTISGPGCRPLDARNGRF